MLNKTLLIFVMFFAMIGYVYALDFQPLPPINVRPKKK